MAQSNLDTASKPQVRAEVLLSEEAIAKRVSELGAELTRDYSGRHPLLIGVLKGATVFLADLVRAMDTELEIDFLCVESYGESTSSSGRVRLVNDVRSSVTGRHVVVIETVADTGHSVRFILDLLAQRRPASLKVCALLDKVPCRQVPVPLDYVGFRIGSEFVVGYGLDVAESLRQLPYVGVATPRAPGVESSK